jgi:integrase
MTNNQRRVASVGKVVGGRRRAARRLTTVASAKARLQANQKKRTRLPADAEIPLDPSLVQQGNDALEEESKPQGQRRYQIFADAHAKIKLERVKELRGPITERRYQCDCKCRTKPEKARCRCTALKMFYAFYEREGLIYGSISTYLGNVNAWRVEMGEAWDRCEIEILQALKYTADVRYAITKTASATAITSGECDAIIQTLYDAGEVMAAHGLLLMAATGSRWDDVFNLAAKDMNIEPSATGGYTLLLHYRVGKNRQTCDKAHLSRENTDDCLVRVPARFGELGAMVRRFKKAGLGLMRPFGRLTTNYVGRVLRANQCKATTYCFRKHFAARIHAENPNDLSAVSARLGHRNLNMGKAFYLDVESSAVYDEYRRKIESQ